MSMTAIQELIFATLKAGELNVVYKMQIIPELLFEIYSL